MTLPDFITFVIDGVTFIMESQKPNLIGKVVKISNQDEAIDFSVKQVQYPIKKLKDLNIFVVWAGYLHRGENMAYQNQEHLTIENMASYYRESIADNKVLCRRYKSANSPKMPGI